MPQRPNKPLQISSSSPSVSFTSVDTETVLASQLLDDTIALAVEDNATADAATFAAYIVDMLPPEVLETLKGVTGFDVGDERQPSLQQPHHAINSQDLAFLTEVWAERVAPPDEPPDTDPSFPSSYECELCDRVIQTTRHHLHPRETHDWLRARDPTRYTDKLLGTTVALCRMCHSAVHRFFPNRVLAEEFHTLDLLLGSDKVCAFAKWASTLQGRGNLRMK